MKIGIVGHEAAKFTTEGEEKARRLIYQLLSNQDDVLVSGGCHLGGIDIWAEEIAGECGLPAQIFRPATRYWNGDQQGNPGYKQRNIQIADHSEVVHCIVVDRLPDGFKGMRFGYCYHCKTNSHVKSGGCWTMHYAAKLGKETQLHIIHQ